MAIIYSQTVINARLQGVVTSIGNAGLLRLLAGGNLVSTITLANPCGVVGGGVLTFTVPVFDLSATGTGVADSAVIEDAGSNLMISGLTVGIPLSGANVIINNGANSTLINIGQIVTMISGQIIGS